MIPAPSARAAASILGLVALSSCAHNPRAVDTFLPLAVGNEWTYEQQSASAGEKIEQIRIVSVRTGERGETQYLLDPLGERYYVRDQDLIAFSVSSGIWTVLLHGPVEVGRRFAGGLTTNEGFHVSGETEPAIVAQRLDQQMLPIEQSGYKVITSLARSITVPAGTFLDCLEISHVAGPIIGVKYFAPHVGMVLSEAWVENGSHRSMMSRQVLTHYSVPDAPRKTARGTP